MKKPRATININIDVEIDNVKFDDAISEIISKIHKGELKGEGIINNAIYNYDVGISYLNDFKVTENAEGKTCLIFQSKMNYNYETI
jgi:hypothetical protein